MTGRLSPDDFAVVYTFKYRQSSLIVVAERSPPCGGNAPPPAARCVQLAENVLAARTPLQLAAGFGACQRRSPTGGAANGMPLKTRTSGLLVPATPVTSPFSVRTGSLTAAESGRIDSATTAAVMRNEVM